MQVFLPWVALLLTAVSVAILFVLLFRVKPLDDDPSKGVREELRLGREEANHTAKHLREELSLSLRSATDSLALTLTNLSTLQQGQLETMTRSVADLTESNQKALDAVRATLDLRVKELQTGNESKLEEMRKTVDEKLHDTLEKRLGESFKIVSDRLEAVQRGLGEMQGLATGVGDLKRVLTNVKARGTWAEVQLGALLEQVLTLTQFDRNVQVKPDSREIVEYAIRLPGAKDEPDSHIWLPIDSKFPQEDYLRIQDAAEKGDPAAVAAATESLSRTIRSQAQEIHDKYISPPYTTNFAILFLATEGLYAEVLRKPGLNEELQHKWNVVVAGPTTLWAILCSFRMGFQTLAIEKRASEVWAVLGAVRTEFSKFGVVLDKVKKQLSTASNSIDEAGVRTRAMEKKLRSVELLSEEATSAILELPEPSAKLESIHAAERVIQDDE